MSKAWWKEASVYQIYPSSFKDTTGSGVGDLRGVIEKADYIKKLGVDTVWLSPIFKSPQVDMGYDISDYYDIHEPYGTVADVEELAAKLHERGIKLLMDLVVNHTSDQHEWFKQARSSKTNPFRDFYIWKAPRYDADGNRQPPNNWRAHFSGSAWTYDELTDEYYLHLFAVEQPDLNWENPKVREQVYTLIEWWLKKGIDGFRMDVINYISKVPGFPDAPIKNPLAKYQSGSQFYACGPRLHEFLHEIGSILKRYDAFSVGEMPSVFDPKEIIKAVDGDRGELNMIFHFELVTLGRDGVRGKFYPSQWKLEDFKRITTKYQDFMIDNNGWNALYLENHDQPRSISAFGDDTTYRVQSGKLLANFLNFQSGTVFVYEGQELGLVNVPKSWGIDKYKDLEIINHYNELVEQGATQEELDSTLVEVQRKGRDNARVPMQWDDSKNAGFTTGTPWIGLNEDYKEWNAANQIDDPNSIFSFWSQTLKLRSENKDLFIYGKYKMLDPDHKQVFVYLRYTDSQKAFVVMNFSSEEINYKLPIEWVSGGKNYNFNYEDRKDKYSADSTVLRPYESFVYMI